MLDQRLREGTEAVKAALADAVPPATEELLGAKSFLARDKVVWRGPLIAVATAVAILAVVGITALALRNDNPTFTDEPAPPTTVTTSPPAIVDAVDSWRTRLAKVWRLSVVDVAALPGGGFVVALDHGGSVLWSTDGTDWVEADPQRQVSAAIPTDRPRPPQQPQVIAASGDRAFILDETDRQVWVGDLEAEAWKALPLDTTGLTGEIDAAAIAANDHQVLVATTWSPDDANEYHVVWLIEPETGEAARQIVPLDSFDDSARVGITAVWFQDRWVVIMGTITAVSRDGTNWTVGWDTDGLAPEASWVTSPAVGPDGLIVTTTGGWGPYGTFYSEDGLEWTKVIDHEKFPETGAIPGAAYSDDLGFVMFSGSLHHSRDGRIWSSVDVGIYGGPFNLAASGETVFLDHELGAVLLTPRG